MYTEQLVNYDDMHKCEGDNISITTEYQSVTSDVEQLVNYDDMHKCEGDNISITTDTTINWKKMDYSTEL